MLQFSWQSVIKLKKFPFKNLCLRRTALFYQKRRTYIFITSQLEVSFMLAEEKDEINYSNLCNTFDNRITCNVLDNNVIV